MKTKIICILVMMLLITTVIPAMGTNIKNHPNEEIIAVNDSNGEDIPEPFWVIPSNGDILYNNARLWAGEASGVDVMVTRFYYSTDKQNWIFIGEDWDGTEIPEANPVDCNSPDGDGWSIYWDTSNVIEKWYYLKAEMWMFTEDYWCTDVQVYVKPTPPPRISDPVFDEVVHGVTTLGIETINENIDHVVYQVRAGQPYFSRTVEVKDQFHYCSNLDGKDLRRVCCTPTATASCLKYWATHGYPNITKDPVTGQPINQTALVESLARKMGTNENGTTNSKIANGIIYYLNEHNAGPAQPNQLKVNTIWGGGLANENTGEVNPGPANFSRFKEELEANNEDVIWGFKWYRKNTTSGKFEYAGGHTMVGTEINNTNGTDENGNRYHNVTFMCPWHGQNRTFRMYDNGSFIHPIVGGWVHPKQMITVSENKTNSHLSFDDGWTTIATVYDPSGGWAATWDTTIVTDGVYFIRAVIVDNAGNQGKDTIVVHVKNGVENKPPNKPNPPSGKTSGKINVEHTYTASTTDPDGNTISYLFDWGDDTTSTWTDPIPSGQTASASHTWTTKGTYQIKVKARDIPSFEESDWSEPLSVSMPKSKAINTPLFLQFLQNFFERYPNLFPILQTLLQRSGL